MPLINTVVRAASLCLTLWSVVAQPAAADRPNVIFIICDDI